MDNLKSEIHGTKQFKQWFDGNIFAPLLHFFEAFHCCGLLGSFSVEGNSTLVQKEWMRESERER